MIHNFINTWCVSADFRRGLGRVCGRSDVPFFHQFTCNLCIARDDCTPTECMTILFIPLRWQSIFFVILWLNAMFSLDFLLFFFRCGWLLWRHITLALSFFLSFPARCVCIQRVHIYFSFRTIDCERVDAIEIHNNIKYEYTLKFMRLS